ncbi:uncharacterized protein N0V89_011199 [Didymosphaeria variabile]|uniref:DUF1750-domain-containing protein n=1 Tax=Didymosphaeria variabile TaxID=1932322 RepID=A0A9W8XCM9_9PLEO|nr:uncharacterized protein N0V89_011199 [Didymosphaeria variabile]KAJ4347259.1 hypothetical protein N0V89_011199 [Didymosphaeria variabile]
MYGMNQAYNVPADPSGQVPNQLPQQALDFLTKAPEITRNAAPVAWTFFAQPPPDGTALLMWQPPRMGTHFASDGLIWADAELSYEMNLNGFVGLRKLKEPYKTLTCRSNFKITSGPRSFDDKLWLVHYSMAEPNMRIPAQNIPMTREIQQQLATRGQLQQAGQLIRKEFMLGDTANFPKVEFAPPGARTQPALYGANPMSNRNPYVQQQPPAKRVRTAQPPRPGVAGAAPGDALFDEEENATQDTFDFMTPRDISLSRYKQHHEWMEEIFSSPHAFPKIKPIDLGIGLMGELAPLTADILEAATGEAPIDKNGDLNAEYGEKIKSYSHLTPEKLKEFEKRVSEYEAKEKAEIERLKSAHANKMAALKRSRTYIKAERRLRDSPRTANPDDDGPDPSDAVVADLEESLGVEFDTKKLVVCVEKGGFIEAQQPSPAKVQVNGNGSTPSNAIGGSNGSAQDGNAEGDNGTSLLDFGSGSLGTPIGNISLPPLSQPQSQAQSAVATPNPAAGDTVQNPSGDQAANLDPSSAANDLLDLDVEMSGMANNDGKGDAEWVMVENQGHAQQSGANNAQPPTSNDAPADAGGLTSNVDAEVGGMFDTADFGSFDNLDTAGDALADYTNVGDDNMGLDLVDDSAFGDAFHGTEMHHGDSGEEHNA